MDLFFTALFCLATAGWLAGMIHPKAIGCPNLSRGRVAVFGFLIVTMVCIAVGIADDGTKKELTDFGAIVLLLSLLAMFVWPTLAAVDLSRTRSSRRIKESANNFKPATATPPPKPAPRRKIIDQDTSATPTRAIRNGWSIGEVEFMYEDANSDVSFRRVTVHAIDSTYLKGMCHDRRAERTFRLDRIIGEVVDIDTGEVTTAQKWARKR